MIDSNADAKPFRVILFGGPILFSGGSICPLSPFQQGLLAIVHGGVGAGVEREEIISRLWPNDDPRKTRRRLNQLLYSLKKKTGQETPFECTGDLIQGALSNTSSDLEHFEHKLKASHFSECAELISLGFLRQVHGSISNELSRWIEARDRHLRQTLLDATQTKLKERDAAADWDGVREAAQALCILEPFNEGFLRSLMKALAQVGRVGDSDAAFAQFSSERSSELGDEWKPEQETISLLDRIHRDASLSPKAGAPRIPDPQSESRLVGRDPEKSLLRQTLARPPHRTFRGILVTGEAGIGKTRLVREAVSGLGLDGQAIYTAAQAEFEQIIPLNPLIEALKVPEVGDTLAKIEDPWRAVMYGVMPGHFRGDGPIPQAPQIQPGSVPRRLFEAWFQLLLGLVSDSPVILVLDDLQWADETTLLVLEFLFRRWDSGRLQAVFSLRSEEIRQSSALRAFLDMLRLHDDFLEIPLGDLGGVASQTLISQTSKKDLRPEEQRHLRSLAGGNPFFLIELTLEYLAGRVDWPTVPEEVFSIPLSIRQVLERRLSQLSPGAEKALGALSVQAKSLRIPALSRVAGLSIPECMSGLDQLHEFRLVRNEGVEISVGHELIRQTVYQGLSASRRAWLHEGIARHLQEASPKPPPDELAIHFHLAGAEKEALVYAQEAAERAEVSGAIPEALRFLGIARENTEDPRAVAEIIGRMGHLNYLHQNLEEAAPLLEVAAQRFRRQGRSAEALLYELERVDSLGQTGLLPFRECLEELERIKKEAKAASFWETFMKALDVSIHLFDRLGDSSGAVGVIREARRYSTVGDVRAGCRAQSILALNIYFGDPIQALTAARTAVSVALDTKNGDLELLAFNRLIVVLLYQAQLHTEEGQSAFASAEARFASSGDLILKFFIKLNRAVWHLEVGELDKAALAFPAAEKVIRGTRSPNPWATLLLNRGELELASGHAAEAKESFLEALSLVPDTAQTSLRNIIISGLGLCALQDGDLREAKRLEVRIPTLPTDWSYDPSVVADFRAEMLRMRGNLRGAAEFLGEVTEAIEYRFVTAWIKLNIQRAKILRRISPAAGRTLAGETLERAETLGLPVRARQLQQLVR